MIRGSPVKRSIGYGREQAYQEEKTMKIEVEYQESNRMPYSVRLVNNPRESGKDVNLLWSRASLSRRESDENSNQESNQMPYIVRLINNPRESGNEVIKLRSSSSLSRRDR